MTTIQILGRGCPMCKQLEANAREAIEEHDLDAAIEKVYDLEEASAMGMMKAPGLAIDDELQHQGSLLDPDEIAAIVQDR